MYEDLELVQKWFELVQDTQVKYDIASEDIYIYDEIGFQMGVISTARVITGSHRTNRSTVTSRALNQLVKVCQMAMHNAAILVNENKELRLANQRQKRKRETPGSYVVRGGILIMEEGLQEAKKRATSKATVVDVDKTLKQLMKPLTEMIDKREPRRCSSCRLYKHTARTCPEVR